ncbi:hypothetical protein BV898_03480 [Hypsibius exemplaris]|uniref:Uncharacterized protein n=1 Tax=Hypsibius exemplaris TaxID=2072580 RepID=A0A1W0X593_HYPEX|nr:hypothetical protein BV898_03480 [Hypsibius exemplaris]
MNTFLVLLIVVALYCFTEIEAGCCRETFLYCGSTLDNERTGKCNINLIANALYNCKAGEDPALENQCDDHCLNGGSCGNDQCGGTDQAPAAVLCNNTTTVAPTSSAAPVASTAGPAVASTTKAAAY